MWRADSGPGRRPARRSRRPPTGRRESGLSHVVIVLLIAAFVFRKPLGRLIARRLPNREKRQRVLGTIIAAFLLVIAVRLLAFFW